MGNNFCCQPRIEPKQLRIEKKNDEDGFYNVTTYISRSDFLAYKKLEKEITQRKEVRFIIKIQTIFRLKLSQKRFKKHLALYINILKSELKANEINNPNKLIEEHPGEKLSKQIEITYGKYTETRPAPKYSIFYKAAYINRLENEDFYVGYWNINKKFNGYGIVYKEDGSKYEGFWINGKLDGNGRYFTKDEDFYIGNFLDGLANGEGILSQNKGNLIYKGHFKNDLRHGNGEEIYKDDNSFFKGKFANGKKVFGKIEWKDGSYYEGEFENEKFNGQGNYYWKEGRVYNGKWANGQMNGHGLFTYLNGSFYDGEFHNGLRTGYGKYVWNDNKSYEGYWLNGKQHGKGKYYRKGKIIEGVWINGKLKTITNTNETTLSGITKGGGITCNNISDFTENITNNIDEPLFSAERKK